METPAKLRFVEQKLSSFSDDSSVVYYLPESKKTILLPLIASLLISKLTEIYPESADLSALGIFNPNSDGNNVDVVKNVVSMLIKIGLVEEIE